MSRSTKVYELWKRHFDAHGVILGISLILYAVSTLSALKPQASYASGSASLMLAAFVSGSANVSVSRGTSLNRVVPWATWRGDGSAAGDFEVLHLTGSSNLQDGFFVSLNSNFSSNASGQPNRSPAYSINLVGEKGSSPEKSESVFMAGASRHAMKQDISIRFRGGPEVQRSGFSDRLVVTVAAP